MDRMNRRNSLVRRTLSAATSMLAVAMAAGCSDSTRYTFNWQTFRFEAEGPRKMSASASTEPADESRTVPTEASYTPAERALREDNPGFARNDAPARAEPVKKDASGETTPMIYRVYVTSEKPSEALPSDSTVMAARAPIDKLSESLQVICPGKGPGGSNREQYVVYSDFDGFTFSKRFAAMLDVPSNEDSGPNVDAWSRAIGRLYASEFPRRLDKNIRLQVVGELSRLAEDQLIDGEKRFAAAVLGAYLCERFDPKDFRQADALLKLASKPVLDHSYLALIVRYHQIKMLHTQAKNLQATNLARQTLAEFSSMSESTCYQDIQAMLPR